jgi:hypothetical protein
MKYRYRVLGFLCLLAAITYLDRVADSRRIGCAWNRF